MPSEFITVIPVLGIDYGNTISAKINGVRDYLPGVIDALRNLRELFEDNIHIISKATPDQACKALEFLESKKFWEKTGIQPGSITFCDERHEKAGICKSWGVTHFVDDRLEVLSHMDEYVDRIALNPADKQFMFAGAKIAGSWYDVESIIFGARL